MKYLSLLISAFALLLSSFQAFGQLSERSHFNIRNEYTAIDLEGFTVHYLSAGSILYNLQNMSLHDGVEKFCINPTKTSIALVTKSSRNIKIISNMETNTTLYTIKTPSRETKDGKSHKAVTTAMAFTDDAKEFLIANDFNEIIVFSTNGYIPMDTIACQSSYSQITVSGNKYYIAAVSGKTVDLYNYETHQLRGSFSFNDNIESVLFSPDSKELAVAAGNSGLCIINAVSLEKMFSIEENHNVRYVNYHPDGKYIAFDKGTATGKEIVIYNLINRREHETITQVSEQPINNIHTLYFYKNHETITLALDSFNSLHFWDATALPPLYKSLIQEQVNEQMADWISQLDGESFDDYKVRATDDNAARQRKMLLDEAATAIAKETIVLEDPFISDTYNSEEQAIEITFGDLNPIKLEIPEEEFQEVQGGELLFDNPIYTLDENDEFQLVYLEVTNPVTSKTYVFDKRDYVIMEAEFEFEDENEIIPVDILMAVDMQMQALEVKKEEIMEEKTSQNLLTDKTSISINSSVEKDFDADGNTIYNFNLSYQYDVLEGFSAQEDFGPGQYMVTQSHASQTMLEAVKNALETDLKHYMENCKKVEITVTGTADATPVNRIMYYGTYGEYTDEPYYARDELKSMTVTRKTNIRNNEQLAFIRAAGVHQWMQKNIPVLHDNEEKCEYIHRTEVSETRGSEFRRITVSFKFKDTF